MLQPGHMELFMQGQDKAILEENDIVEDMATVEGEEAGLIGTFTWKVPKLTHFFFIYPKVSFKHV